MKRLFCAVPFILLLSLLLSLIIPSANVRVVSAQSAQLILFWDDNSSTPPGWTCISNNLGEDFFEKFPRGAPAYGGTGGSLTHTHTATVVSCSTPSATTTCRSGNTNVGSSTHTHTTATTVPASNIPLRRGLRIIRCDSGIPSTIPAGAIAVFDSESLPLGWTRYSTQDGYFIKGVPVAGVIAGSNTHDHTVITGGPSSTVNVRLGLAGQAANSLHVHSGTSDTQSNEPPFIEIILAQADSETNIPTGMIGMFNESPGGCWTVVSDIGGDLYHRFVKGSDSYSATGGMESHTHGDLTIITPPLVPISFRAGSGAEVALQDHIHDIDVSFSTESNLPPYRDVIFAKLGTLTAEPSSNSPVCEGSTINLIGSPDGMTAYNWYGPDGWTSTDRNPTRAADNTTAGAYYLSVVNSYGCTSDNATTTVTVNAKPTATASNNGPVCEETALILTGGSDNMTSYSWTGPDSFSSPLQSPTVSSSATLAMAGDYTLTVTNANGCSDNATTTVTVNPKPTAVASATTPVCVGGTIQLTGGPGGMISYTWTGPNGFTSGLQSPTVSSSATQAMAGTYTLAVINSSGCTSDNATVSVGVIQCGGGGGEGEVGFGQTAPPGVACPLALTVNMLGEITTARMTSDGVLCEDCLALDPGKQNSWEAKAGTKLTLVDNQVPRLIKITTASTSPPSSPAQTIGQTYAINAYPSLSATNSLAISISPLFVMSSVYDPNELPGNSSEIALSYYPNPSQGWLTMGSQGIVAELGKAQGTLNYFVPDTLLAKLAEAAASFKVSNLNINPTQIQPAQQVNISVNVANTGGISGDYTVELKVDGAAIESKRISLGAGESQIVGFTLAETAAGKYHIEIAGLKGELVVVGPAGLNWWPIVGIIVAILLALGIWILIRWRRFSGY